MIKYNGTEVRFVVFNGILVSRVYFNGREVYTNDRLIVPMSETKLKNLVESEEKLTEKSNLN